MLFPFSVEAKLLFFRLGWIEDKREEEEEEVDYEGGDDGGADEENNMCSPPSHLMSIAQS